MDEIAARLGLTDNAVRAHIGALQREGLGDIGVGMMAWLNLIAILMLFPVAMSLLKDYQDQLKAGHERPVLDPAKFADLDIDTTAWDASPTATRKPAP
mgnify:CR=1 FL=1